MKKQYNILYIAGLFLLFSCNDFLDLNPVSEVSTNSFYQTEDDFLIAINGVYGSLQPIYGQHMYKLGELRSDNTLLDGDPGGNRQPMADIDFFEVQTTNNVVLGFWNDSYKGIANGNTIIDRINDVNFQDGALKDRIQGEAYFLRALMYFNLVRIFGDVPLVVNEVKYPDESKEHMRQPIDKVYEQIELDLNNAINLLPELYSGQDIGRVTNWAAKSLLGKVHLTRKEYDEAISVLKDVVDHGPYVLEGNYADLFKTSNKNGIESIFEVQFNGNIAGEGSSFVNDFAPRFSTTVAPSGEGQGNNQPTDDLVSAFEFESGDLRFAASMDTSYFNKNAEVVNANYINKFLNGTDIPHQGVDNFPVLRYADILLMLAEAEFIKNGGGLENINAVRRRANLPDLLSFDLDVVLRERRIELAFENHRWFDLVRTGKAVDVMNTYLSSVIGSAPIAEYQLIYPIPQAQIDANPEVLDQNEGYQ